MVNYIIEASIDYGMDPKFVTAIIQQEVGFQGLSPKVVGVNGKGYMQLTSAPIRDFLGFGGNGQVYDIKVDKYGPEFVELMFSRGFDVTKAKTKLEKETLYRQIFNYLKDNKDPEFNIRLGTLVLRFYTNKYDGDVYSAARNYNGSPHKDRYANNVSNYNEILNDTVPSDTTYMYSKKPLRIK